MVSWTTSTDSYLGIVFLYWFLCSLFWQTTRERQLKEDREKHDFGSHFEGTVYHSQEAGRRQPTLKCLSPFCSAWETQLTEWIYFSLNSLGMSSPTYPRAEFLAWFQSLTRKISHGGKRPSTERNGRNRLTMGEADRNRGCVLWKDSVNN